MLLMSCWSGAHSKASTRLRTHIARLGHQTHHGMSEAGAREGDAAGFTEGRLWKVMPKPGLSEAG